MLSSIRTPGRNRLSRCCASCSALPASCSHNVTLRPARAVTLASAVPQRAAAEHRDAVEGHCEPPCCDVLPGCASAGDLFERPARTGREVERIGQAQRQPLGAGPGDHGAVVGAKLRRRHHERDAGLEGDPLQHLADRLVGGDAAGGDQRGRRAVAVAEQLQAGAQPVVDDLDNRLLERGAEIGDVLVAERRDASRPRAAARSSSPDSEKSGSARPCIGRGSAKRVAIAARRFLLDLRSAGIAEAQQLRGLVEGLADGVVDGGAEQRVIADATHRHDLGVAAGGEEQAIGKRRRRRSAAR